MTILRHPRLHLIIVVGLCIIIRILFWFSHPGIGWFADSDSYYVEGKRLLAMREIVDDARPPLYSFFLAAVSYASTGQQPDMQAPAFLQAMTWVVIIQSLAGMVSLILIWQIMGCLHLPHLLKLASLLFLGTNIFLFGAEHLILTEALTTTWLLSVTVLLLSLNHQPARRTWWLMAGIVAAGFFLKPVYIGLPFLLLPLISLLRRKVPTITATILIMATVMGMLGYYQYKNLQIYHYPGLSRIGDINLLGKILVFHLPIEAGKEVPYFYDTMTDYRRRGGPEMPYRFLETYNSDIYSSQQYRLNDLPQFNRLVITASLPRFLLLSLAQFPFVLLDINDTVLTPPLPNGWTGQVWLWLVTIDSTIQWTTLIFLVAYPLSIYYLWKSRTKWLSSAVLVGSVAAYQLVFTVFFAYDSYGRLLSPGLPIIYLVVIACGYHSFHVLRKTGARV